MISWLFFLPFLLPGKVVVAYGPCPPGFDDTKTSLSEDRCYHASSETMDHRGCVQYCFDKDSYLAEPESQPQVREVNHPIKRKTIKSAYVGGVSLDKMTWKRPGLDKVNSRMVPLQNNINVWNGTLEQYSRSTCSFCPIVFDWHLKHTNDCTENHVCVCQSQHRDRCSNANECSEEHFNCTDRVCVCKDGFYLDVNTYKKCHPKKNKGEPCPTGTRECTSGLSCLRGTCVKTGTTKYNKTCNDDNPCEAPLNCTETDAGKKCRCKWHSDYNDADELCEPNGKLYGEQCTQDKLCVNYADAGHCGCDPNALASSETCICKDGHTYDAAKEECSCELGDDPHKETGQCLCINEYKKTDDGKSCELSCAGGHHKLSDDGEKCVCINDDYVENDDSQCVLKNDITVNEELGKGDGANRDKVITALNGIVQGTKDSPDEEKNIIFDELKILRDNKVGNLTETEIKTALEGIINAVIEINKNVKQGTTITYDDLQTVANGVDDPPTIDQARLTDYQYQLNEKKNKKDGAYLTSEEIRHIITAVNDKYKPEPKSDPPYALIIGGILGGIVVIGGVGIVMRNYVCPKKKKKKKKKKNADGTDGTESMVSGMSQASGSTVSSVKTGSPPGSDTSSVKSGSVRRESVESVSTQDTLDSQDNGSGRRDSDTGSQDSGGSGGSGGSVESGGSDRSKGSQV